MNRIRVLVVDDSALMRKLVTDLLSRDRELEVVDQARDGKDALEKVARLKPDVITLDVEMPIMDGLETLKRLMATMPTPVIMVSSLTQTGAETTLKCLDLGAVDFVGKPSGSISLDIEKVGADLVEKVKMASHATPSPKRTKISDRAVISQPIAAPHPVPTRADEFGLATSRKCGVLVIGSSTGGPNALHQLVPCLPGNLGVPIVIVQHLPEMFTRLLANRLNDESPFQVREAQEGDQLRVGEVLIAPGGKHLKFDHSGTARLTEDPPIHGVRPAVDITMQSLVPLYRSRMVGVLLTGMGRDGAQGMKEIRAANGMTIAEDQSTCVVYGMPKAAADLGAVQQMLPLPQIPSAVVNAINLRGLAMQNHARRAG